MTRATRAKANLGSVGASFLNRNKQLVAVNVGGVSTVVATVCSCIPLECGRDPPEV